jgi:transposase InsO family protein
MNEDQKREVATFRFGVICDFVNGAMLEHGEQERLLRKKCARKWRIPFSEKTRLSRSVILRWITLYKESGHKLQSLYPHDRSDRGKPRRMDEDTCVCLIRLRQEFPRASIRYLIKKMHQRGLVTPATELHESTVYRFLHQQGLMKYTVHPIEDRRKFEAESPNDMWQSDVMHGPMVEVEHRMKKSYLVAFIDDHSRLVPHGEFYLSEALPSYLDAFEKALLKRGLPRRLYVDNGPAFRSKHLEQITASLGIALIHSRPYKPQGRGKVERFFRTVRGEFLTDFKGTSLDELNQAFECWLNDSYHQRKHGATGQSPFARFTAKMECLRVAPHDLQDHFRKAARRRVAKDRTITLNGKLYEAPVALIGKRVTVLYHEHEPERVEIQWNQESYGFVLAVNMHINCRVKRDKNNNADIGSTLSRYQGGSLWSPKGGDSHE